jgi:hypothetical protein
MGQQLCQLLRDLRESEDYSLSIGNTDGSIAYGRAADKLEAILKEHE